MIFFFFFLPILRKLFRTFLKIGYSFFYLWRLRLLYVGSIPNFLKISLVSIFTVLPIYFWIVVCSYVHELKDIDERRGEIKVCPAISNLLPFRHNIIL